MSRTEKACYWLLLGLPAYLLSTGPVAWLENNGYLSGKVFIIYLPLVPLMRVEWINGFFYWWTVVIWGGSPYGYTTV